jgi:hypothetical protein
VRLFLLIVVFFLGIAAQEATPFEISLQSASKESDLRKRLESTLLTAEQAYEATAKEARDGNLQKAAQSAPFIARSIRAALDALAAMGKHPAKNSTNYKKVELQTSRLLRLMDQLSKASLPEDRAPFEASVRDLTALEDELINAVMMRKPR